MNDTLYHYIDPGFSHTAVGNYTLLLLLGPASYSLAVMHGQQLMVWRKTAPLNELTQSDSEVQEVLNFKYADVLTSVSTPCFTLVPEELFDAETTTEAARYLDVHPADVVFAQPLDQHNQVVFKIDSTLATAASRLNLQRVMFAASGWIQAIAANQPSGYQLYLQIFDDRFDIAYFRQGKLHLYNTFEYTHEDELAYYTVFACQQLKLDMSLITVILSGVADSSDHRFTPILNNIFKAVELNELSVAAFPENLPAHQLLAITALPLCASLADA